MQADVSARPRTEVSAARRYWLVSRVRLKRRQADFLTGLSPVGLHDGHGRAASSYFSEPLPSFCWCDKRYAAVGRIVGRRSIKTTNQHETLPRRKSCAAMPLQFAAAGSTRLRPMMREQRRYLKKTTTQGDHTCFGQKSTCSTTITTTIGNNTRGSQRFARKKKERTFLNKNHNP